MYALKRVSSFPNNVCCRVTMQPQSFASQSSHAGKSRLRHVDARQEWVSSPSWLMWEPMKGRRRRFKPPKKKERGRLRVRTCCKQKNAFRCLQFNGKRVTCFLAFHCRPLRLSFQPLLFLGEDPAPLFWHSSNRTRNSSFVFPSASPTIHGEDQARVQRVWRQ
jgi:hypothetical protein